MARRLDGGFSWCAAVREESSFSTLHHLDGDEGARHWSAPLHAPAVHGLSGFLFGTAQMEYVGDRVALLQDPWHEQRTWWHGA